MTFQELLEQADSAERQRVLDIARESWDDPDMVLLLDAMVEEGQSAWEAAGAVEDQSIEGRHRRSLLRMARRIQRELFGALGRPTSEWIQQLLREGAVHNPPECMIPELKQAAAQNEMELIERTTYEARPKE